MSGYLYEAVHELMLYFGDYQKLIVFDGHDPFSKKDFATLKLVPYISIFLMRVAYYSLDALRTKTINDYLLIL